MADIVYDSFHEYLGEKVIDMNADTFNCMLLADTYVQNAAHALLAEVSTHEITGTGYTAGGQALTGTSWVRASNRTTFDANDVTWDPATLTARWGVVYDITVTVPLNPLVVCIDFVTNQVAAAVPFKIEWAAAGVFYLERVVA